MIVASLAFSAHPIGAFVGCILSDRIGRRKTFLLATVPFVIGWCILSIAASLTMINIAFLIMGFGSGLKEASSMCYIGEIWYLFEKWFD